MKKLFVFFMFNYFLLIFVGYAFSDGIIIVCHDEYIISDSGFSSAPSTKNFVLNITKSFAKGKKGNFLVYSSDFGLVQKTLAKTITEAGHNWIVNNNEDFSLSNLKQYDGIFLAGGAADNSTLIDYVQAGGNIFLEGGTGDGGATQEARRWKKFLNHFGLEFQERYNGVGGTLPVESDHELMKNVESLYYNNGNSILKLNPSDKKIQIIHTYNDKGLIAVYENPKETFYDGMIVVNHDEYTLSDIGFRRAPDAKSFIKNIANCFTREKKGSFLVYSNDFGLTQKTLAHTISEAGHDWKINYDENFSLSNLQKYDGIFLAGGSADNITLIKYVKSGGNVYLEAGTGDGGAQAEANRWKTFLNYFGLEFKENYNGIGGVIPVESNHELMKNVKNLYYNNGNSIIKLNPQDNRSKIIHSYRNQGLIAVYRNSQSMLTGCVQLIGQPLDTAKAMLIQSGEIHQNSIIDNLGCYSFDKVNLEKSFTIIIRKNIK